MLLSFVAVTLLCISSALTLPTDAPNITNSSSGNQAGALAAAKGVFLKRPPPRVAPPGASLTVRPPAPFLWRPDPEAGLYINFTSYERSIPWLAGSTLLYVQKLVKH